MNIFVHRPLALCCAFFLFTFFVSAFVSVALTITFILISLVFAVIFFSKKKIISAVCLVIILALTYGHLYYNMYISSQTAYIGQELDMTVEVTDISFSSDRTIYFDASIKEGCSIDIIHLTIEAPHTSVRIGDVLDVTARIIPIENTDEFDNRRYCNSKGIFVEGEVRKYNVLSNAYNYFRSAVTIVQDYCSDSYYKYTDEDTAGLLTALSTGDKSGVDDSVRRDFSRIGTSHMLAISGMHLAVVMGVVSYVLGYMKLSRKIRALFACIVCICFVFIAGASLSVIRSGVMFIFFYIADFFGRRSDSLTNLFLGVSLIILFSPSSVYDVGLILSFTSTLGIIVVVGAYMRNTDSKNNKGILKRISRVFVISVLTTLAAMSFSFIPILVYFDDVSLISVISNLILAPLLTLLLVLIIVFLCVSFIPFAAGVIGCFADLIADIMQFLTSLLSSVPYASVSLEHPFVIGTYTAIAVGVVIIILVRRVNAFLMPYLCWFLCFVVCFAVYNTGYGDSADVVFFSASGSDAILMRNREGSVYLDMGRESRSAHRRAFETLNKQLYTDELDYWIFSEYRDNSVYAINECLNLHYVHNICIPFPLTDVDMILCEDIEKCAAEENVGVIYYEYDKAFECNGNSIIVYTPISFKDTQVTIPSADVVVNQESISYYGRGYFDNQDNRGECDYLFIGECGSRRKQVNSPDIDFDRAIIAEGNDTAGGSLVGKIDRLNDKHSFVKENIG